jgi:hypothetical protein
LLAGAPELSTGAEPGQGLQSNPQRQRSALRPSCFQLKHHAIGADRLGQNDAAELGRYRIWTHHLDALRTRDGMKN